MRLYVITFTNTQIVLMNIRTDTNKTGEHCYENFAHKLSLLSILKFKVSILLTLILKYYCSIVSVNRIKNSDLQVRLYVIQGNRFGKVNIRKPSLKSVNELS